MADTFGQVIRQVRLHCPLAPYFLVEFWCKKAYSDICDKRGWSWLRAESEFLLSAQKSGTVNVTRGSVTVSGGTMAYATSDINRQFRVGNNSPVYTIIDAVAATSYTLDRVFGSTTATGTTAAVLDAYLTVPADFQRFIAVIDVINNWQLHLWVTEDELNSWDAQRSTTGTPWAVASRKLATAGSLAGRIQFELWPYQTGQYNYPYYYMRRPEAMTEDTALLGPLAADGNILVTSALAECAKWPGLEGKKNPYFNLALAAQLQKQVDDDVDRLQVLDEEIYMSWMATVNHYSWAPYPQDSKFFQSHAVSSGGVW